MAAYETVLTLVSDAAEALGLGSVSSVVGNTDAHVSQLRQLLKTLGRQLVARHTFLQCVKEHSFTTSSASTYALPTDFLAWVDGSGWNRTQQRRLTPVSAQEWQALRATSALSVAQVQVRSRDAALEVWPQPPTSGDTIAFEYRSRYWVAVTGSTTPTKDAPTLDTDVVCLEAELVKAGLRLAFLRQKGFDSTAAALDFTEALHAAEAASAGALPTLELGSGPRDERFLEMANAPLTGFGFDGQGGLG